MTLLPGTESGTNHNQTDPSLLTWEDEGGSWEIDTEDSPMYNEEHESLHEVSEE